MVAADQQQEHSELCLAATGTGHLQITLLSLRDDAGSGPEVEDVGVRGGKVRVGIVDHLHHDLLVSEPHFVFEEGLAEHPFFHADVCHSLQLLRV